MRDPHGHRTRIPLSDLALIDPESLPGSTPRDCRFKYIDISAAAAGKLTIPDEVMEFADAPSRARRVLRPGDVIMSTVRPNLRAFAYCHFDDGNFVGSTGFAVLRAKGNAAPYFLLCAVLADDVARQIERFAVGSNYPAINSSDVCRLLIPAFALAEQEKIAAILTSIDTAIEKTEALIEKYQQIKAGLMHDLFTRGVLPNGQLRPARKEAPELYRETTMGWIPAEWGLTQLGTLAKIVSGVTLGAKDDPADTIDAPYLRVANVQDGYLDLREIKTVRVSRATLEYLRLQPGDVLMNEGGDFDKLGRGAVWAGEINDCVHQNHVFRVRTDPARLLPHYLAFYSESSFGKKYFLLSSKQSTNLASINSTQLNAYPIAVPEPDEQREIVRRLSAVNCRISTLRGEEDKLRSKKLGLMQDLLTGRVPVKVDSRPTEMESAA